MLVDLGPQRSRRGRDDRQRARRRTDGHRALLARDAHRLERRRPNCGRNRDALDLFAAAFPAGTVTGAPKIRAMQLIDELEPVARGFYAGSIAHIDFDGDMDSCIILRCVAVASGQAYWQASAGIVADSDPAAEYDEIFHKTRIVRAVLGLDGDETRLLRRQLRLVHVHPRAPLRRRRCGRRRDPQRRRAARRRRAGAATTRPCVGPGPGRPEDAGRMYAILREAAATTPSAARRVSRARRRSATVFGGDGRSRAAPDARQNLGDHARRHRASSPVCPRRSRRRAIIRCASRTSGFPAELRAIAASDDGVIQGVAHRDAADLGRAVPSRVDPHAGRRPSSRATFSRAARPMNDYPAAAARASSAGSDLSADDAARAIGAIMDETISPVRTAALLAALAAKGETADEIVGAARAMRERSVARRTRSAAGDRHRAAPAATARTRSTSRPPRRWSSRAAASRSPSTATARPRACAGAPTCSRRSASQIECSPEASARAAARARRSPSCSRGSYHPATRAVGPVRSELGVRTIFNVLGPLTNPAGANRQVVGVAEERHLVLLAEALRELGGAAAAVVHAASGLDEIAGDGPTYVVQFDAGGMRRWTLASGGLRRARAARDDSRRRRGVQRRRR